MPWMLQCPNPACGQLIPLPEKSGRSRCSVCGCLAEVAILEAPDGWPAYLVERAKSLFKPPSLAQRAQVVWLDGAQKVSIPSHGLTPDRKSLRP